MCFFFLKKKWRKYIWKCSHSGRTHYRLCCAGQSYLRIQLLKQLCSNRTAVFLYLYSSTNTHRYYYGYYCTNYDNMVLVLEGTTGYAYLKILDPAQLKSVQDTLINQGHKKIMTCFADNQNFWLLQQQKRKAIRTLPQLLNLNRLMKFRAVRR